MCCLVGLKWRGGFESGMFVINCDCYPQRCPTNSRTSRRNSVDRHGNQIIEFRSDSIDFDTCPHWVVLHLRIEIYKCNFSKGQSGQGLPQEAYLHFCFDYDTVPQGNRHTPPFHLLPALRASMITTKFYAESSTCSDRPSFLHSP